MKAWILAASTLALLSAGEASAQCTSDGDCRGGRVCENGECVEASARACGKDTDCPEPLLCVEQKCQAPSGAPPPAVPPTPTASPPSKGIVYAEQTSRGVPEMWIPGLVVFTLAWGATIGITAGTGGNGEQIAFASIPVFGPFILLGHDRTDSDYIAPLIISGVVQTASLGFFIAGLALTKTERVPVGVALGDGPDPTRLVLMPGPVGVLDSFGLNLSLANF